LRDSLRVRAILATDQDPGWKSTAIEDSGVYRLAESTDHYRIYLAPD
jgi:hypothetical protein